jgi:predicted SAM-dependent methyltransferase
MGPDQSALDGPPVKLNLGAGDRYANGWWNIDFAGSPHRKDEEVDLRSGVLPWAVNSINLAYAGHLLEHLFVDEVITLLQALRDRMAKEGELMVVGPDVVVAQGMAIAGTLDVTMDSLTNGGHRWPGDEHRWHCTTWAVEALLRVSGWSEVTRVGIANVPEIWPVADRRPQWQCAVSARP